MFLNNSKPATTALALLALTALNCQAALAADYPERPITVLIGSSPGSGQDVVQRTLQPYLEKCLGTSLVLVNKASPGGALSVAQLKETAPDGYTIGTVNLPNTVAQAIERKAAPPWESFDYLANLTQSRVGLHVSTKSEFKDFKQFQEYAAANPKVVTLALGGFGNDDHITQLQAMKASGIQLTLVPIGDGGLARTAMLGGHVTAFSASIYEVLQYKDDIRTLWIAAEERNPLAPDVPTLRELGYNVVGGSNQGMGAPKGTPPEALAKLRGCYETATSDAAFIEEAKKRGLPIFFKNAADLETFAREQWTALEELWKVTPWAAQ